MKFGAYDINVLSGIVKPERFREVAATFFNSPGELLFYFYGHGCLGSSELGYFATSDAAVYREGVLMLEIGAMVRNSPAAEVVLIYDCCHAGKASITSATLNNTARDLEYSVGRDLLAGCAAHETGWETANEEHKHLGAFSAHVLDGLEGAAAPRGSSCVRGSALGEYVTRIFQQWGQDPIAQCKETGTHHCVITFGFTEQSLHPHQQREDTAAARIFGAPFKPSQLFVGRSAELARLVETLVAGDRPIAISATVEGLGGIGKTELVLHLMHHHGILHAYDVVVWLDGGGPLAPQWERLALEAGVPLPKKRPNNFVQALENGFNKLGRVLVVLDNATDWNQVSA